MEPVKLFGIADSIQTLAYQSWLKNNGIPHVCYDIGESEENQFLLSKYYKSGRLRFPTLVVKNTKLRKPKEQDLIDVVIQEATANLSNGKTLVTVNDKKYTITKRKIDKNIVKICVHGFKDFGLLCFEVYMDANKKHIHVADEYKKAVLGFLTSYQIETGIDGTMEKDVYDKKYSK